MSDRNLDLAGAYGWRYATMVKEFKDYQAQHSIKLPSADEAMCDPCIAPEHRAYCANYSRRWDEMEAELSRAQGAIRRLWGDL